MLDIGWSELVVIGVVALVVIGPKDLPRALHTAGKLVRKARLMSHELHSGIDEMLRQSELEELRRETEKLRQANISQHMEKMIDPAGDIRSAIESPVHSEPPPPPPPKAS